MVTSSCSISMARAALRRSWILWKQMIRSNEPAFSSGSTVASRKSFTPGSVQLARSNSSFW